MASPDAPTALTARGRRLVVSGLLVAALAATSIIWWRVQRAEVFALLHAASHGDRREDLLYRETQASLIKTRPVLQKAVERLPDNSALRKQANPIAWLERSLTIEAGQNTEIIRVSLRGAQSEALAAIINAVVDVYLQDVVASERNQSKTRLQEYERLLKDTEETIQGKNREVQELRKRGETDLAQILAHERLTVLNKEYDELVFRLEKAQAQLGLEKKRKLRGEDAIPDYLIEEQVARDSGAQRLYVQKLKLERIIAGYEKDAVDSPNVKQLLDSYRADLKAVEKQLEPFRKEARARLEQQLRQGSLQVSQGLKQLEEQVALMVEEEKLLRKRLDAQVKEMGDKGVRNAWIELDVLLKEIDRKQEMAKQLGLQCEGLRLELKSPPRVTLIQPAAGQ